MKQEASIRLAAQTRAAFTYYLSDRRRQSKQRGIKIDKTTVPTWHNSRSWFNDPTMEGTTLCLCSSLIVLSSSSLLAPLSLVVISSSLSSSSSSFSFSPHLSFPHPRPCYLLSHCSVLLVLLAHLLVLVLILSSHLLSSSLSSPLLVVLVRHTCHTMC